ncbi:MAG: glycosyltransferase [Candidatus Aenigmatarchaeota archaeon]|nr:MAG: glycosyltransferase [Candidatus Aenigmarchaeota archaeon]
MTFLSTIVKTVAGASLGAALGLWVFIAASLIFFPPSSFDITRATLENMDAAIGQIVFSYSSYEVLSIISGAIFGMALMHSKQAVLMLTTMALGGAGGLLIYISGFIAVNLLTTPRAASLSLYSLVVSAVVSATPAEYFMMALGACLGFVIANNTWRSSGLIIYTALVGIIFGYLTYTFVVTLPLVPLSQKPLSILLFIAETASLSMVVIYAFYTLDFTTKVRWLRDMRDFHFSKHYMPAVAFHVATFNEPPDIVIDTLKSLLRVDYPRNKRKIMVIDDSTEAQSWKPVKSFCDKNGISFIRRPERKGYKAGALNYALKKTPSDVDLVAVVDADYIVESDYLKSVVGYFVDQDLGFVQTPQDYRNRDENYLTEQYYYADSYFYRVVMLSRNEANAIIFAGTMGIIRKEVLEKVGGWGEGFICEDAELSVRILNDGYKSLYINRTFGRGLIPTTYDSYQKQLYRWSFGGVKILKAHFWKFLFSAKMSLRQKFDFLIGGLHWFDGTWILLIASILSTLAVADIFNYQAVTYHQREVWLVGLVPIFLLVDGVTRLHMALSRSMGVSLLGTFGVMGMWFSVKFNNMFASYLALIGVNKPFIRTSKKPPGKMSFSEAVEYSVKLTKFETAVFIILMALALAVLVKTILLFMIGTPDYARLLMVFWLTFYALIFGSAPLYAYLSYRTSTRTTKLSMASLALSLRNMVWVPLRKAIHQAPSSRGNGSKTIVYLAVASAIVGGALLLYMETNGAQASPVQASAVIAPQIDRSNISFGSSIEALDYAGQTGWRPEYSSMRAGRWMKTDPYGWQTFSDWLDKTAKKGTVPVILWDYWGKDAAPDKIENGYGGKTVAEWHDMTDRIALMVNGSNNEQSLIVLEPEFNKAGMENWTPFNDHLINLTEAVHAGSPNTSVVIGFGNWNQDAWATFAPAIRSADMVGYQSVVISTQASSRDFADLPENAIAASKKLRPYGKPIVLFDLAVSTYPHMEALQNDTLSEFFSKAPQLSAAGTRIVIYRHFVDATAYVPSEEMHWGLVYGNGTKKPAYQTWINGVGA